MVTKQCPHEEEYTLLLSLLHTIILITIQYKVSKQIEEHSLMSVKFASLTPKANLGMLFPPILLCNELNLLINTLVI